MLVWKGFRSRLQSNSRDNHCWTEVSANLLLALHKSLWSLSYWDTSSTTSIDSLVSAQPSAVPRILCVSSLLKVSQSVPLLRSASHTAAVETEHLQSTMIHDSLRLEGFAHLPITQVSGSGEGLVGKSGLRRLLDLLWDVYSFSNIKIKKWDSTQLTFWIYLIMKINPNPTN